MAAEANGNKLIYLYITFVPIKKYLNLFAPMQINFQVVKEQR